MGEARIPMPSDEVLREVAARHRVTVRDLRSELECPSTPFSNEERWSDLDGAAATVYRRNKAIRSVAERWATSHMKHLEALSNQYGVPWQAIVREVREGDWPDEESAARALRDRLAPGRERVPWWLRWLA